MNVVDSSAWLEFFADGPNADFFAPPITDPDSLIVPSVTVLEVFKRVLQQRSEADALAAIAVMHQGQVADLSSSLAIAAAKLGVRVGLPLADSVVLATALEHDATLWTQDADFDGLDGVRYVARSPR